MHLRAPATHRAVLADPPPTAGVESPRSQAVYVWAILTLVAMFPLIWFGGLTTSHGAGLAVPDWPNTYGYNMFAVRWDIWLGESAGGIFLEHTHRLLGSLVGLLAIATVLNAFGLARCQRTRAWSGRAAVLLAGLAVANFVLMRMDLGGAHRAMGHLASLFGGLGAIALLAWLARWREPRRWVRWLAVALLGAIIIQGVLGGLRVTEVNLELAIVHGVFAQLTLCLAGLLVLVTGAGWVRSGTQDGIVRLSMDGRVSLASRRLLVASGALTVLIFGQLVLGALMRHYGTHYGTGLAVPDFPLSYGHLVPPTSEAGLSRANDMRVFDLNMRATTLVDIWLHTSHRIGALLVTLAAIWVFWRVRGTPRVVRPARHTLLLAGLLGAQICLGVATIWMGKPADVATAHVAVGALLLLASWLLTVRVARSYVLRPAAGEIGGPVPRQTAAQAAHQVPAAV